MKQIVGAIFLACLTSLANSQHLLDKPDNIEGTCSVKLNGETSGSVASPGFPTSDYTNNLNCLYEITAGPGRVVVFEGKYVNLQTRGPSGACYDYIAVYRTGNTSDTPSYYCGRDTIPIGSSVNQKLIIQFVSDGSITNEGFAITLSVLDPDSRIPSINCNFDEPIPLCAGWTQYGDDDFDWTFGRGATPSSGTGPTFDHSSSNGEGRYAFIEASDIQRGSVSILATPPFSNDVQVCLSFWYHAYGTGLLQVIMAFDNFQRGVYLDHKWTDTGPNWQQAQLTLPVTGNVTQIGFEATVNSYRSDVAIDDVVSTDGACLSSQEEKADSCLDEQFQCRVGHLRCVPISFVCDEIPDCFDGSDEDDCTDSIPAEICPPHQTYQVCASPCNHTCGDGPYGPLCALSCARRCACPFHRPVFHEGRCLEYVECPREATADEPSSGSIRRVQTGLFILLHSFADWVQEEYGNGHGE